MNRRALLVSVLLLIVGIFVNFVPLTKAVDLRKSFAHFPVRLGEWDGRIVEYTDEVLKLLRVTEYINRYYRRGAEQVDVYVGYYDSQGAGRQIHSPKHCLPGGGWSIISQSIREMDLEGTGKISFVQAVYEKNGARQLFVYWYRMKDAYVTNDYMLKVRMILNSIRFRRNEAAFVRLSTPLYDDERRAFEVVRAFMLDFMPQLQNHLPD